MIDFVVNTLILTVATTLPILAVEYLYPSLFFKQYSIYCNDKTFGKKTMYHCCNSQRKRFSYVQFAFKCLMIGMTLFGIFCFYYTVTDFNNRLTALEESKLDMETRLAFAEYKAANCYPND